MMVFISNNFEVTVEKENLQLVLPFGSTITIWMHLKVYVLKIWKYSPDRN